MHRLIFEEMENDANIIEKTCSFHPLKSFSGEPSACGANVIAPVLRSCRLRATRLRRRESRLHPALARPFLLISKFLESEPGMACSGPPLSAYPCASFASLSVAYQVTLGPSLSPRSPARAASKSSANEFRHHRHPLLNLKA